MRCRTLRSARRRARARVPALLEQLRGEIQHVVVLRGAVPARGRVGRPCLRSRGVGWGTGFRISPLAILKGMGIMADYRQDGTGVRVGKRWIRKRLRPLEAAKAWMRIPVLRLHGDLEFAEEGDGHLCVNIRKTVVAFLSKDRAR